MKIDITIRRALDSRREDFEQEADQSFVMNNVMAAALLLDYAVRNNITHVPNPKCPDCGNPMFLSENRVLKVHYWQCQCGNTTHLGRLRPTEKDRADETRSHQQLEML